MFHPQGPTFLELTRQALSSIEDGYDLLAPKFDRTPFRTPDALIAAAVHHVGSVETAIDLGCGTGAVMQQLRPLCRRRLVGVDLSRNMLAVAEARLRHVPGGAALEWRRADMLSLPPTADFELATCFGALGHIPEEDAARLFHAVHGALRPGGRFVFPSGERPAFWTASHLLSRSFNAAMRVRNALWRPPFVMYYLRFLLPEVVAALQAAGFAVNVVRDAFPSPWEAGALVIATKPG